MQKISFKKLLSEWSWKDFGKLNAGTLLVALGVYFFRMPNNFSTGGVSGISILLAKLLPFATPGAYVSVLNVLLLVLGFLVINGSFGIKTIYSTLLFSAVLSLLEIVCPLSAPLTDEPLMELLFSVMIPAFGSAILFDIDASTGGSDITAMILKKYSHMDIGKALLCVDSIVALSACFVFDITTGLYSILGLLMKALLVDSIMESFSICKYFNIITDHPEPVCRFLVEELNRSATLVKAEGYYTGKEKTVLVAVLTRPQAIRLNVYLRRNDPTAFVTILNTSSIIGKGFRDRQ